MLMLSPLKISERIQWLDELPHGLVALTDNPFAARDSLQMDQRCSRESQMLQIERWSHLLNAASSVLEGG